MPEPYPGGPLALQMVCFIPRIISIAFDVIRKTFWVHITGLRSLPQPLTLRHHSIFKWLEAIGHHYSVRANQVGPSWHGKYMTHGVLQIF